MPLQEASDRADRAPHSVFSQEVLRIESQRVAARSGVVVAPRR